MEFTVEEMEAALEADPGEKIGSKENRIKDALCTRREQALQIIRGSMFHVQVCTWNSIKLDYVHINKSKS